jgi:1-acyl-sn-glycerol-3-phosphate acyltransferase
MLALRVIRGATRSIVWRIVRRRIGSVEGLENIPLEGPLVVVPNHASYFDHFVVQVVVQTLRGRPVWFLTKRESFARWFPRMWATAWYGIPVDRDVPAPDTLREVRRVLTSGDGLCVYPEGTRGDGGPLREFKPGAFRFALAHGAPIIPVGLHGTADVLRKGDRWFRRGRVDVVIGRPLEIDVSLPKPRAAEALAGSGREIVAALVERAAQNARHRRASSTPAAAAAVDAAIVHELGDEGVVAPPVLRRLRMLTTVVGADERRGLELRVQRVRLAALRAVNRRGPARVASALVIRLRLARLRREAPGHPLANYLLGRWCLAMPRALGGGPVRALEHLAVAATDPSDPTRSALASAEAHRRLGDPARALGHLRRVVLETPHRHPHHASRVRRAERLAVELQGPAS